MVITIIHTAHTRTGARAHTAVPHLIAWRNTLDSIPTVLLLIGGTAYLFYFFFYSLSVFRSGGPRKMKDVTQQSEACARSALHF